LLKKVTKAVIKDFIIVKCKTYITSKTYKVILKRISIDKAIRPFYYIYIDRFNLGN